MSIFSELDYNSSVRTITGIQFGIQSPEEIKKRSVVHVTQPLLFEANGDPIIGGLFDPRMGVLDRGKLCPTDEQNNMFCPGYFGHIVLARPVIYTQFMSSIIKILKSICIRCSRLRVPYSEETIRIINTKKGKARLAKVFEFSSKMKACNHEGCNAPKTKSIKMDGLSKIIVTWAKPKGAEDVVTHELTAELILKIFKRITDKDCALLGLSPKWSRPEWLICTVLPVSPPTVRPSVTQYNNVQSHDDITHKLIDIIKTNNTLRNKIQNNSVEQVVDDWTSVLQYHISTLIDNDIPGINPASHRSGRVLKTLKQRLKGKDSRIRGNLMGKRVNFSARSVITPGANISIDELGVPFKIAMNLTFPEIVTQYNIEELYKYVRNGPETHPGAKSIKSKTDNRTRRLHNLDRTKIILNYGDIVNRHLKDGDVVLFNRQPSLHKMSMMAHRVRVMKGNTFRLNLSACKPYNADFDGDEMNLHVPQSLQTAVELSTIANVKYQVVSPSINKPLIYPVQDSLLGIYLLTQNGVNFTKNEMMNILMKIKTFDGIYPEPAIKTPVELWTSRQLLSLIMPDININIPNSSFSEEDDNSSQNFIKINRGNFTQGAIDKGVLSRASKGLVHVIFNDFGPNATQRFIDDIQGIVTQYLLNNGFSVGISDLIADKSVHLKMKNIIDKQKKEVLKTIKHVHLNIFENLTGRTNNVIFEERVKGALEKANPKAGQVGINSLGKANRFVTMVNSGSKGSKINIAQMICCLGQQSVDGKRIPKGYTDRTLPHYHKFDDTPESRGFVESSFISGLTPQEFFFHAMGGREGLIDTAVKSITGDTKLIIMVNNKAIQISIGEWIDTHLKEYTDNIKHYGKEDANMELLDITKVGMDAYIPTTDSKGNMSWAKITNITRHDPSEFIYHIKTNSGRDVKVVASKSLLIWNKTTNAYEAKNTMDVKIGDKMPLAIHLQNNIHRFDNIPMKNYLPQNKFVYGNDFNKAKTLITEIKGRLPNNWWLTNNNNTFTLPYTHSNMFKRTLYRSNIKHIKNGCVYPYRGKRTEAEIPDTFKLDNYNGFFIGIYLAEGTSNINSGSVSLCNNDPIIRNKIGKWFDKLRITHKTYKHKNTSVGKSISINGHSTIMAKFLDNFVGHGARNKYMPPEFNFAPDEFLKGLIDGYFSGDGTVSKNSVDISSASKELIEGIAMILTRFGIYSKISVSKLKKNNFNTKNMANVNRLAIRSTFARKFAETFTFTSVAKQIKLDKLKTSKTLLKYAHNYRTQNDTILDEIVSIEKYSSINYPKVYDLTIPSTKNFGLANGLQVYDTSETGYIQRKLMKAMEDLKVTYDMSVRNENGEIIQFVYGDDGIDATKMETISLTQRLAKTSVNYQNITLKKLIKSFKFAKTEKWSSFLLSAARDEMFSNSDYKKLLNENFLQIKDDRKKFNSIFKDYPENKLVFSLDFSRLIETARNKFLIDSQLPTNLNPLYVIEKTNELVDSLHYGYNTTNLIANILIRFYLAPKIICKIRRFNVDAFNYLVDMIKTKIIEATIQNGEMVGPIAAQSIGEPSTQMTLNTFHFAGVAAKSNVTRGVPRIKEILHISKSIKKPSLTVYLNDEYRGNKDKAKDLMSNLELTILKDIVKSSRIYYDPNEYNTNVEEDKEFLKLYKEFNALEEQCEEDPDEDEYSPWLLRFELDRVKMMNKNITMDDIHLKINEEQSQDLSCTYTDDNYNKMIFRIRNLKDIKKLKKKPADQIILIDDDINYLKHFEKKLLNNTILKGVSNIDKVTMRKIDSNTKYIDGSYSSENEWILDTDGINMIEIFSQEGVDYTRTYSNDVIEINDILGIEASRNTLIKEIIDVIEASAQYVNSRHVSLLAENMTHTGRLMSVDRFGINRSNKGPLAKCSFEETPGILLQASLFGDYDTLSGVSANIMVGQIPDCGTGVDEVLLDEIKFVEQMKYAEEKEDAFVIEHELEECQETNFDFDFDIDNVGTETISLENIPELTLIG